MTVAARVEIRLEALQANYQLLRSRAPGSRVIAAVKANAYGHGIVRVAEALGTCDSLAVARLVEAEVLRDAGIVAPILLMGGVADRDELAQAQDLHCDLVIHSSYQAGLLKGSQGALRVWLKVDTGMRRLGLFPDEVSAVISQLQDAPCVSAVGLMTHLANSDDLEDDFTRTQLDRFAALAEGFDGDISIANSAALLGWQEAIQPGERWPGAGAHWVRPGISLYGISPLTGVSAAELGLQPVMNFDTSLISVKAISAGDAVGYGGRWTASRDTWLGIAAAGYGDGYSRFIPPDTPVLVNGRRAHLAGVVSMDLIAIDLGPKAADRPGDPVRLWGVGLPVEEIAAHAGTTAYPLVTGVRERRLNRA